MSRRTPKSGRSPTRSTKTDRQDTQGSETEASSDGIPPQSIRHMRDNLRSLIDTMGDGDQCGCNEESSETSALSESVQSCRCCGKQSSSESGGERCSCSIQPAVHKVCTNKPHVERSAMARCVPDQRESRRRFRGYDTCDETRLLKPVNTSSSEECPCEDPCPGKLNARKKIKNFLNKVVGIRENIQTQHELYNFRLKNPDPSVKLPRTLIFDLVDGIPKPKPPPVPKEKPKKKNELVVDTDDFHNKVDVYYFDHGNSGYYRTTDRPPPLMADFFVEQTDLYATRFWAEIFATIHVGVAFVTTFVLQLVRFALYSVLRPLTVGCVQLVSDYFLKPLLSVTFNGVIQPLLILAYNVATSFRDLCEPIAHGLGYFLREVAAVLRAVRIVEVNQIKTVNSPSNV